MSRCKHMTEFKLCYGMNVLNTFLGPSAIKQIKRQNIDHLIQSHTTILMSFKKKCISMCLGENASSQPVNSGVFG